MEKPIVLGIGNLLMEDDGVGNDIAAELKRRGTFPGLQILAGETDMDYCLEALKDADRVILIDAAYMGTEPCSVTRLSLESILRELPSSRFSHQFDILHGMKWLGYEGDGILLAVEVCSVGYHYGLSSLMKAHFHNIVDEIEMHLENYLQL